MNIEPANVALAESVTPQGVRAYLAASGWKKLGRYHGNTGDVYCPRKDDRESVLVPSSVEYADYVTRIIELADTLARVEKRHHSAVMKDLSLTEVDVIRVRVPLAHEDSSIAISAGVELLDESRKLLMAAACSAARPGRVFRAGRNRKAAAYIEQIRVGQTEPGSFVVNLLAPITESPTGAEVKEPQLGAKFKRKVTRMLVSGLSALREATELVNRGNRIREFERRIDEGISANLCEATTNLINAGSGVDVSVSWALAREQDRIERSERTTVKFTPSDGQILEKAARRLRERKESSDERIEGHVSALAREHSDPEGRATIKAKVEGTWVSVKVDFSESEYRKITNAHARGRKVSIEGDLRREGQRWRLMKPRGLTVMKEDD